MKKAGDQVAEDEVIAKIETDKTTIDVKSPKSGVIESILFQDGSAVTANTPVAKLKVGASGGAPAAKPSEPAAAAPKKEEPKAAAAPPPPPPPPQTPAQQARVTPLPSSPSQTIPVAQIPITPAAMSSAAIDINKITGTRAETRV